MKEFRSRQKNRRFFQSRFFLIVLILLLGLFVRGAYTSFTKKRIASIEEQNYAQRLLELQEKKGNLETEIEHLQTERGLEEEFRNRFNAVREGETVIRIIE